MALLKQNDHILQPNFTAGLGLKEVKGGFNNCLIESSG